MQTVPSQVGLNRQRPSEYEHVKDIVPTARVEFIDAGHFLHLERPEETNAAMLRFLQESPVPSPV